MFAENAELSLTFSFSPCPSSPLVLLLHQRQQLTQRIFRRLRCPSSSVIILRTWGRDMTRVVALLPPFHYYHKPRYSEWAEGGTVCLVARHTSPSSSRSTYKQRTV